MHHTTRPQWRDAVKEDQNLTEHEVIIGLLIADYWKTDSVEPVWAAAEVLMRQSRLSRTMVFRAAKGLRLKGYLNEVEKARHNRSPRWLPTIPESEQCPADTNRGTEDTNRCTEDHRNHTQTSSTPNYGSTDLDCESRPPFGGQPMTNEELADYEVLRAHMHNYNDQSLAAVYALLRAGERTGRKGTPGRPWEWPGATARKMHAKPSKKDDVSSWQGFFLRALAKNQDAAIPQVRALYVADPWATSKSA